MSSLAPALLDSLLRLLPPPAADRLDAAGQLALRQVITALAAALERGELGLDLEGPAPAELEGPGWAEQDGAQQGTPGPEATDWPTNWTTEGTTDWPEAHLAALKACGWLVDAGSGKDALEDRPEAPVVRAGRWLRWRRWHQQLSHCIADLIERGQSGVEPAASASQRQEAKAQATAAGLDQQQGAAVQALLSQRLVLLSGGPGTGKTSTVVQMLAAALGLQPQLRLHLAAPTGKAAARLGAAVAEGAAALEPGLAGRLANLPCGTLHRLLEARGDGAGFRRGPGLPLDLDLLVVDEVSMVDLPLMQALLAALPPQARLLLVGDPNQLPPVGPGAVLLELCRPESLAALGPAAVELRTTYRNEGAIAALAAELRSNALPGTDLLVGLQPRLEQLNSGDNVQWLQAPGGVPPAEALVLLREHQQRLGELAAALGVLDPQNGSVDAPGANALLSELERLILLSPIRQGPWGVEGVQRALLGEALDGPVQHWPLGTPVLNRRNLPEQELANGDIGVLVAGTGGGRLVLFPAGRLLHPARLTGAEPALALTVHKSQGSQYGEVLLLLPAGRQLDARLLYTGLTRARRSARLYTAHRPA
jgi:exodeoxyribonuclease V alpha subunit